MASSYSTVRYGSSGDDVRALQEALNSLGYDISVDGIFGKNTQAAVKSYQKANGLAVDGIAGANTWGALTKASEPSTPSTPATPSASSGTATTALNDQLAQLIAQFNATPTYTPKTDEEIRQQAQGEFQSYYDQLKLNAQTQQQQSDLALSQQRDQLQATYDKQREESERQYEQAYSQSDRQMLSRGMQRSSYAAQTLANIDSQGAQAQQAIADAQAAAEGDIDAQRTQLAQQLAAQLAQYDTSQAADVLNRIRELEEQEYQRGQESAESRNNLSLQIYQLMQQQRDFEYQQQRDQIEDQQWQQQFDESVRQFNESLRKKSSSSGGTKAAQTQQTLEPQNSATTAQGGVIQTAQGLMSAISSFTSGLLNKANTLSGASTSKENVKYDLRPAQSTRQG